MKALPFVAGCLLAGCAVLPDPAAAPAESPSLGTEMTPVGPPAATPSGGRDWDSKSVLYARDGTPIPASGPGLSASDQEPAGGSTPAHRLAGEGGGGRMYILELYQTVIEERDSLTTEVTALTAELERMRRTVIEADRRIGDLEAMQSALERDKRVLVDENLELAGRLTTAQIRRLQAEKILLEKELEELRSPGQQPSSEVEGPSQP